MRKGKGNPTYRPEFTDIAKRLCLAFRATDAQLAEAFGVHRAAIEQWKLRYPLFARAIKEGKAPADANVAASLYMRAVGFEREAVKVFCNAQGDVTTVKYMEYYPPEDCTLWAFHDETIYRLVKVAPHESTDRFRDALIFDQDQDPDEDPSLSGPETEQVIYGGGSSGPGWALKAQDLFVSNSGEECFAFVLIEFADDAAKLNAK